jgi:MFS family permease
MYYSFPALLLAWERDLGWSKAELSGAFTVALVTSAFLAPMVGRIIDRGYGTHIFTGSALLGATCLVVLSRVTAIWQFYAVWIMLGVAMAGSLYEACFAVLTKTMGVRRKQAITLVTLVAGFAGTLSFPGNHALVGLVGWRGTMLVLAAIVSFIAVPLIWLGCRTAESFGEPHQAPAGTNTTETFGIARNLTFWLLAAGFATIALNHGVLLTHLLPLLDERGLPSGTAVLAASMIGPMQVTGRLMMLAVERRVSSLGIFVACFIALGFASLSLLGAIALPLFVISFVLFQGAGYGVTSILRPVITADLLGYKNYGLIAGLLAVPFQAAAAAAPTIAALIWGVGGYDLVIWFAGGAAVLGLISLLTAATLSTRTQPNASVAH